MDTGLKEQVLEEIRTLAERYEIEKVILFGSRARGDYKDRSDVDLAFFGGGGPAFCADVQDETSTLLTFDLIDLSEPMSEELRESIDSEGVVIYEKNR